MACVHQLDAWSEFVWVTDGVVYAHMIYIHSPKKVKDIFFWGVFFIIRDLSLQFNKKYPQKK